MPSSYGTRLEQRCRFLSLPSNLPRAKEMKFSEVSFFVSDSFVSKLILMFERKKILKSTAKRSLILDFGAFQDSAQVFKQCDELKHNRVL